MRGFEKTLNNKDTTLSKGIMLSNFEVFINYLPVILTLFLINQSIIIKDLLLTLIN